MNAPIFWIKKMEIAQESERAQVLVDAAKALPQFTVSYNLEENRLYITLDPRKKIESAIKANELSIYQMAELLNIDRTSLQKYINGKRNIPYDHLIKLLAIVDPDDNEACIKASDLKSFLDFYEGSKVLYDDKGFFNMESGQEYKAEDVIEMFNSKQ